MLPWSFSEEAAVEKYAPQLQHNLWVVAARTAVLSVITGGGKWVGIEVPADPLYQHLIVTAERKFWRCVESGEPPTLFGVEPPKPRVEAVRIVDMSSSNAWSEFAAVFLRTRSAHLEHEAAKAELKSLVPADAQQAFGHGVRAKRSKSGAISFDLLECGGQRCSGRVNRLAPWLLPWPRPKSNWLIPKSHSSRRSAKKAGTDESRRFVTLRFPAGSRSCAKYWASTKLRPCRLRRLINPLVSSISPRCSRTHRGNGLPPIGPCARSVKLLLRGAWVPHSPTPEDTRFFR